jgi:hypothetical protein
MKQTLNNLIVSNGGGFDIKESRCFALTSIALLCFAYDLTARRI